MNPRGPATRGILGLLALANACAPPPLARVEADQLAAELDVIAAIEARDADELAALAVRVNSLERTTIQAVERWRLSHQAFEQARQTYAASASLALDASSSFQTAIEDFRAAEQQYRRAALAVIVIAASSQLCATKARTQAFRTELKNEGYDLSGKDIDHIWPKSLGGADHPLNYQVLDAHLNRSLGAGIVEKFMTQPLALVQGLTVSALTALAC